MTILSYERDADGDPTVYDALRGGYRWMTAEEKAPRRAAEAAERERLTALRAERDAKAAERDAFLATPEGRVFNVANNMPNPNKPIPSHPSYGRAQIITHADGSESTINWPGGGDYIPPRTGE